MKSGLGLKLLRLQLANVDNLKHLSRNNINFIVWAQTTNEILELLMGEGHELVTRYKEVRYRPTNGTGTVLKSAEVKQAYLSGLDVAASLITDAESWLLGKDKDTNPVNNIDGVDKVSILHLLNDLESKLRYKNVWQLITDTKEIFSDTDTDKFDSVVYHNMLAGKLNRLSSTLLQVGGL